MYILEDDEDLIAMDIYEATRLIEEKEEED